MTPVVASLCMLGLLVVVPLGLRFLDVPRAPRTWWAAAAMGAVAIALPRGGVAAGLALPYAAATGLVALAGGQRFLVRRRCSALELAALTASASLAVAGISLVAERGGWQLLGFSLGRLSLTVAHFHFAGFAAALLAGLVLDRHPQRLSVLGALAVPAGTALVALGHFVGEETELAGAVALTLGLLATGVVVARCERGHDRGTRLLLLLVATAMPVTMALAIWYAAGEQWDVPHPSIALMAATHGTANALAVGLASVLAWTRLQPAPL